jgi:hypothetical protein
VLELSTFPTPIASFLPGRWWQHRRFRYHVGDRSCPVCSCRGSVWHRRLRRGRRVRPRIGEGELRLARTVVWFRQVSVARRQHSGPSRAWQHVQDTVSLRRCWTLPAVARVQVAGADGILRDPRGDSVRSALHCDVRSIAACSASRGYSGLLFGRVGGNRPAAATSRRSPTETHIAVHSRLRIESDCRFAVADKPALLTGNRQRRWSYPTDRVLSDGCAVTSVTTPGLVESLRRLGLGADVLAKVATPA